MTRLDSLRALYDAVKAGDVWSERQYEAFGNGTAEVDQFQRAASGSVDAALAFIAATLPRWKLADLREFESGLCYAGIYQPQGEDWPKWTSYPKHEANGPNPATALLLAALAAHIAEEEAK